MPEHFEKEHIESQDDHSPENEGEDLELGTESTSEDEFEDTTNKDQEETAEAQSRLDEEYNKTSYPELNLDNPTLDTSKDTPKDGDGPGASFVEAPLATVKGMWHRVLAPYTWGKRTSKKDKYTVMVKTKNKNGASSWGKEEKEILKNKYDSWAKKYDAFKKAREETVERRGAGEEPVGAKWYSMPVGIANITAPIRGLWYAYTSPNYLDKHDLLPRDGIDADFETLAKANKEFYKEFNENIWRGLLYSKNIRHVISKMFEENNYYKRLAENVEWKKTKDNNPNIKSNIEKISKKAAKRYNKDFEKEEEAFNRSEETYERKIGDKSREILNEITITSQEDDYQVTFKELGIHTLSKELIDHAVNRLLSEKDSEKQRGILNTITSTLSKRILAENEIPILITSDDELAFRREKAAIKIEIEQGLEKKISTFLKEKIKEEELLSEGIKSVEFKLEKNKQAGEEEKDVYNVYVNDTYIHSFFDVDAYKKRYDLVEEKSARTAERNYVVNWLLDSLELNKLELSDEKKEEIKDQFKKAVQKFLVQEINKIVRPKITAAIKVLDGLAMKVRDVTIYKGREYIINNNEFINELNKLKKLSITKAELKAIGHNNPESPVYKALDKIQRRRSA